MTGEPPVAFERAAARRSAVRLRTGRFIMRALLAVLAWVLLSGCQPGWEEQAHGAVSAAQDRPAGHESVRGL
jgi:hypothetical protein